MCDSSRGHMRTRMRRLSTAQSPHDSSEGEAWGAETSQQHFHLASARFVGCDLCAPHASERLCGRSLFALRIMLPFICETAPCVRVVTHICIAVMLLTIVHPYFTMPACHLPYGYFTQTHTSYHATHRGQRHGYGACHCQARFANLGAR